VAIVCFGAHPCLQSTAPGLERARETTRNRIFASDAVMERVAVKRDVGTLVTLFVSAVCEIVRTPRPRRTVRAYRSPGARPPVVPVMMQKRTLAQRDVRRATAFG
jgi:hypothetical protein